MAYYDRARFEAERKLWELKPGHIQTKRSIRVWSNHSWPRSKTHITNYLYYSIAIHTGRLQYIERTVYGNSSAQTMLLVTTYLYVRSYCVAPVIAKASRSLDLLLATTPVLIFHWISAIWNAFFVAWVFGSSPTFSISTTVQYESFPIPGGRCSIIQPQQSQATNHQEKKCNIKPHLLFCTNKRSLQFINRGAKQCREAPRWS